MSKIALDKLEPGMKLAKAIENASGMVLLGEGVELTIDIIDRIRNMGIESVYVQGLTKPSVPKDEALKELDERFKAVTGQPHMDDLKLVLKEHIESLYE